MLLDSVSSKEKLQIAWGKNTAEIGRVVRFTTSVSSVASTAVEAYAGVENKLAKNYREMPSCYHYALTRNTITVHCGLEVDDKKRDEALGLVDIEDIVKEITSTSEGTRLWEEAKAKVNAELWQDVLNGTLGRVKYFRMIKGFTQKELADKVGMKQPDISRMERPGYRGSPATYKKLALILRIEYKGLMP